MRALYYKFKDRLAKKEHKYKAKAGGGFPSRLEGEVYTWLSLMEKSGEIRNIERQVVVELIGGLRWKIDFRYEICATKEKRFAEAKGFEDNVYLLKLKLWKAGFREEELEIWKASKNGVFISEVVPRKPRGDKNGFWTLWENRLSQVCKENSTQSVRLMSRVLQSEMREMREDFFSRFKEYG